MERPSEIIQLNLLILKMKTKVPLHASQDGCYPKVYKQ